MIETRENKTESPQITYLDSFQQVHNLLHAISNDYKGGKPMRNNLFALGVFIGQYWLSRHKPKGGTIIGIERSGTHLSKGISSVLPSFTHVLVNGKERKTPESFGIRIDNNLPVLFVDGAIMTGTTTSFNINFVFPNKDLIDERVVICSAFGGDEGVNRIAKHFPNTQLIIGEEREVVETSPLGRGQAYKKLKGLNFDIGELASRE